MALIEYDEYKQRLRDLGPELEKLSAALDMDSARAEARKLEDETAQDGFWNDLERSQKVQQRDVLTGVLLALAANKLNLLDLLRIGVFAHGLAGDCVAEKEGRRGCCAGMIAERMGEAWKRLEK